MTMRACLSHRKACWRKEPLSIPCRGQRIALGTGKQLVKQGMAEKSCWSPNPRLQAQGEKPFLLPPRGEQSVMGSRAEGSATQQPHKADMGIVL